MYSNRNPQTHFPTNKSIKDLTPVTETDVLVNGDIVRLSARQDNYDLNFRGNILTAMGSADGKVIHFWMAPPIFQRNLTGIYYSKNEIMKSIVGMSNARVERSATISNWEPVTIDIRNCVCPYDPSEVKSITAVANDDQSYYLDIQLYNRNRVIAGEDYIFLIDHQIDAIQALRPQITMSYSSDKYVVFILEQHRRAGIGYIYVIEKSDPTKEMSNLILKRQISSSELNSYYTRYDIHESHGGLYIALPVALRKGDSGAVPEDYRSLICTTENSEYDVIIEHIAIDGNDRNKAYTIMYTPKEFNGIDSYKTSTEMLLDNAMVRKLRSDLPHEFYSNVSSVQIWGNDSFLFLTSIRGSFFLYEKEKGRIGKVVLRKKRKEREKTRGTIQIPFYVHKYSEGKPYIYLTLSPGNKSNPILVNFINEDKGRVGKAMVGSFKKIVPVPDTDYVIIGNKLYNIVTGEMIYSSYKNHSIRVDITEFYNMIATKISCVHQHPVHTNSGEYISESLLGAPMNAFSIDTIKTKAGINLQGNITLGYSAVNEYPSRAIRSWLDSNIGFSNYCVSNSHRFTDTDGLIGSSYINKEPIMVHSLNERIRNSNDDFNDIKSTLVIEAENYSLFNDKSATKIYVSVVDECGNLNREMEIDVDEQMSHFMRYYVSSTDFSWPAFFYPLRRMAGNATAPLSELYALSEEPNIHVRRSLLVNLNDSKYLLMPPVKESVVSISKYDLFSSKNLFADKRAAPSDYNDENSVTWGEGHAPATGYWISKGKDGIVDYGLYHILVLRCQPWDEARVFLLCTYSDKNKSFVRIFVVVSVGESTIEIAEARLPRMLKSYKIIYNDIRKVIYQVSNEMETSKEEYENLDPKEYASTRRRQIEYLLKDIRARIVSSLV